MSEVTITVRGENQTRVAPERARVHVSVRSDGADRVKVLDTATRIAEPVRASLIARADATTLVEWSSGRMTIHAERPWNSEGKRLAPVYHASIDFTGTFDDFSELSLWVTEVSGVEGVEIGHVDWHLTPETRATVEQGAAAEAIRVAVRRAEAYAAALGRGNVTPVSIADQGLLHSKTGAAPMMMRAMAESADSAGFGGMSYQPEDIVISATVEAQFSAR